MQKEGKAVYDRAETQISIRTVCPLKSPYFFRLICITLLAAVPCSGLLAEPIVEEKTIYYEFTANSKKEIWQQILQKSPRGAVNMAGQHAVNVATTEWQMSAQYTLEGGLNRCTLKDVQAKLQITIRLPHWTNKWQADKLLADNWDNYVRMVSNHEDIHRQYAIKMAQEYETELMKLDSYRRCSHLKEAMEKTRIQVIGKYVAQNKWFDANEYTYQKNLEWF